MKLLATFVTAWAAAACVDVVEHNDVAYDPRGGQATATVGGTIGWMW